MRSSLAELTEKRPRGMRWTIAIVGVAGLDLVADRLELGCKVASPLIGAKRRRFI